MGYEIREVLQNLDIDPNIKIMALANLNCKDEEKVSSHIDFSEAAAYIKLLFNKIEGVVVND